MSATTLIASPGLPSGRPSGPNILEDLLLQHPFLNRDDMMPFSDLDMTQKHYECLQPKKYTIVLDDVWSTNACDCLALLFHPVKLPAAECCSPLLTLSLLTRFHHTSTALGL